jgi:hypothetical protein
LLRAEALELLHADALDALALAHKERAHLSTECARGEEMRHSDSSFACTHAASNHTTNSPPRSASHLRRCSQSGMARSTARQNFGVWCGSLTWASS